MKTTLTPAALAAALACALPSAFAQTTAPAAPEAAASAPVTTLPTVTISASADASAAGLSPAYPGGQVARGGRAGILGTKDNLETPFSITAYTNELIQDKQAKSVGDVLQNDPSVRMARGFGNFQESYFIRGFLLGSDDVAYNGLYSLLPRQYIATELFERVEVLRGASAFLNGATPSGGGIGGNLNLVPKRAPNEALNRVTVGVDSGAQGTVAADIARRFGPDQSTGVRLNAAYRDGGTAVDDEKAKLSLLSLAADWRGSNVRVSGDIGWQDNQLKQTRPSVTLSTTTLPDPPDASTNFAQPWTYSNERDLFGTLRAEFDLTDNITAWGAYGLRRSDEANSLGGFTLTNASNGDGYAYRFDNTREDSVDTGELGIRGKLRTGSVGHEWVTSASYFKLSTKNAYAYDAGPSKLLFTNMYNPVGSAQPPLEPFTPFFGGAGNDLNAPALTNRTTLTSFAVGDTLAFLDDSFFLTLGARYQKFKVESYAYNGGAELPGYSDSRVSPLVGAVYRVSKQVSVYGNYIEGLVKGDIAAPSFFPPITPVNNGEALDPYVSKQKEIGVKYDAGRIGLGVAAFSTDKPRSVYNDANVFTSEGYDRHQGIELTTYGEAMRGLRLLGGLTWLDVKQHNTFNADTDGKRTLGIPEWQGNLGAEWDVLGVEGLAIEGRVVYTGSFYANSANTISAPSWTRFDTGVRYLFDVQGRLITLRGRVDNLTDRNYWASSGGYPDAGYLVIGMPRTFTFSASVDF